MRYLVTMNDEPPFMTNVYDYKNNWILGINMVIYDLEKRLYTRSGTTWHPIEIDQL